LDLGSPAWGLDSSHEDKRLICCRCQTDKPIEEFAPSQRARGNRKHLCSPCRRAYHREWYLRNKREQLARMTITRPLYKARVAAEIDRIEARPCADCGRSYPAYVMDFDHVSGTKNFCLARARSGVALRRIVAEVTKCEVVCANCHRARTHARSRS